MTALLQRIIAATLLAALAGAGAGWWLAARDRDQVQADWDVERAARALAESTAINARLADNALAKARQDSNNLKITKDHDEEIDSVRRQLAAAGRMRVPAFCASGPGPASAPNSAGADGSAAADSAGRLLDQGVDERIRALMLQSEEVAATGRACQAFVRENGMAK